MIKALDLTLDQAKTIKIENNLVTVKCDEQCQEYLVTTDYKMNGEKLEERVNDTTHYIYRQN